VAPKQKQCLQIKAMDEYPRWNKGFNNQQWLLSLGSSS